MAMTDSERPDFDGGPINHKMYFIFKREDYLFVCFDFLPDRNKKDHANPHCMALLLAVLEGWSDNKKDQGVRMSQSQWLRKIRNEYSVNVVLDSLSALIEAGLLRRQEGGLGESPTYYLLIGNINKALSVIPADKKEAEALLYDAEKRYYAWKAKDRAPRQKRKKAEAIQPDTYSDVNTLPDTENDEDTYSDMNNPLFTSEYPTYSDMNTPYSHLNNPLFTSEHFLYIQRNNKETNLDTTKISVVPSVENIEAPTSPLRTHLSEQNEILLSHPVHKFILFDSLTHPTKTIAIGLAEPVPYNPDGFFKTEKENDRRKRAVEDVVRRLTAKGFPITVEDVTWKYIKAEDENVVESNQPSYSQSIPETTPSSQENGGVGNQKGKYAAGYAGVSEQKEPEQAKPAKETPERKAAREIVEYTEANRYVAGQRGGLFAREPRGKGKSGASQWDKNFEAALKIVKRKITPEQYFQAYDSQNNEWWNNTVGSLTCVEMAANTKYKEMRAVELWDKVASKSASIVQPMQSSVANAPVSGDMFTEEAAQRIMEAVKARSTPDLTFESRMADREGGYVINIRVTSRFYGSPRGRSGFTNEAEVWALVEKHEKAIQEELLQERQKQGMEAQQWQRASYNGLQA